MLLFQPYAQQVVLQIPSASSPVCVGAKLHTHILGTSVKSGTLFAEKHVSTVAGASMASASVHSNTLAPDVNNVSATYRCNLKNKGEHFLVFSCAIVACCNDCILQ